MKNQTKSFLTGLHFDGCFCYCLFVFGWNSAKSWELSLPDFSAFQSLKNLRLQKTDVSQLVQKSDQPNQLQNSFTRIEHEKLVDRTSPKNTVSFKFSTRFKETQNIFVIVVMTFLTGLTWKPSTQRSQRDGLCTVRARLLLKTLTLTRMNPCSDLEC